jgi:hypothetical protein
MRLIQNGTHVWGLILAIEKNKNDDTSRSNTTQRHKDTTKQRNVTNKTFNTKHNKTRSRQHRRYSTLRETK